MKHNCLDSSGWIEIFHDGPNAKEFLVALNEPTSMIVSTISIYEVYKYAMLHADALRARKIVEAMQQGSVIEVNAEIAIQAAELSLRTKLPMADSLIYTTAVLSHAALWTQDEHFKGLPSVRYFSKVRSMKS